MSVHVIIPARFASTRLPGKPLLAKTGKPLIQHVVEQAAAAEGVAQVVVATDDERIAQAVAAFGGHAVMTSPDCPSGTDRVAQAAAKLGLSDDEIIINVQGDEPEMPPAYVERLAALLATDDAPIATLAVPLSADRVADPARVKVVCDLRGRAMYFSRSPIPFDRDGSGGVSYRLHLGIYGYRVGTLKKLARLATTPAERSEKLEQLRALENGYAIAVAEVADYGGAGIDTPADYAAFVERYRRNHTC